MKSERKLIIIGIVGLVVLYFLSIIKDILGPFILAGIFAYLLNPVVTLIEKKLHLSRGVTIFSAFCMFLALFVFLGTLVTQQIIHESSQLRNTLSNIDTVTKVKISSLPDWLQPTVTEALFSLEKSRYFSASSLLTFFPQIATEAFSILIFFFSSFYLLKDGRSTFLSLTKYVPEKKRSDFLMLSHKINDVFGAYLRGQILLVIFVSVLLFLGLTFLGMRYTLLLAIFSGFAELVPIIGPLVAGGIAVVVGLLYSSSTISDPIRLIFFIFLLYFTLRQIQDYFITPYVLGKVTRLHPILVLFSVVVGGHLYGVLGLVLAVPIAAMLKILFEHFLFNQVLTS